MNLNHISSVDRYSEMNKAELETEIKRLEVREAERRLSVRNRLMSGLSISIPEATIIVALVGFLGTGVGSYLQKGNEIALKQREFESQLLLNALSEKEPEVALSRISFLIDAGMIEDANHNIANLIISDKYSARAASPSGPHIIKAVATRDAPMLLQEILRISGTSDQVTLKEINGFAPIAAILRVEGPIYELLFDGSALRKAQTVETTNWVIAAIVAHEIGHVALGHTKVPRALSCLTVDADKSVDCLEVADVELEADNYAGCILRLLGAPREDTAKALLFLPKDGPGGYPNRDERIAAVLEGWNAGCSRERAMMGPR